MNTRRPPLALVAYATLALVGFGARGPRALAPQATNPPYLSQFPSAERIRGEINGSDAKDTAARQMGACWQIQRIVEELAGQRRWRNQLTPDERRLIGEYRGCYMDAARPYDHIQNSPSHPDKPKWYQMHAFYETDDAFLDELLLRFFPPEFRAGYYQATGKQPPQPAPAQPTAKAPSARPAEPSDRQTRPTPSRCPVISVTCPDTVGENRPAAFTAGVSGGDPKVTPTFNWTVSAGTISAGQGTSTVTVDTTGLGGHAVTATVDVGGYSRECATSDSCTTVSFKKPEPRKFDEYVGPPADRNARLDNFAIQLQQEFGAQGYIIFYGGRASRPGKAQAAADKATDYLVNNRGIDRSRIVTVAGGYREQPSFELWIVENGASPPAPTPTVDAKDVKPPRRPAAKPRTPPKGKKTKTT